MRKRLTQQERFNIAKKTGFDPMAKSLDIWCLVHERTGQIVITGKRALCEWKKKREKELNPMSSYIIKRPR